MWPLRTASNMSARGVVSPPTKAGMARSQQTSPEQSYLAGTNIQRSEVDPLTGSYNGPHPRSRSMTIKRPNKLPNNCTFSPRTGDVIARNACVHFGPRRALIIGAIGTPTRSMAPGGGPADFHGFKRLMGSDNNTGGSWPR